MAFWDRFTRKKNLDTSLTAGNTKLPVSALVMQNSEQHPIFRTFEKCGMNYESLSPGAEIKLSLLMYRIFPFAKRAINDMAAMVGDVHLIPREGGRVSKQQAAELTEALQGLPILAEWDWEQPHQNGVTKLATRAARSLLLTGMTFVQDRYEDENLNRYQGALLFDSRNFAFVREKDSEPARLVYASSQYPERDAFFHLAGFDYQESRPWAKPLLAGGEFFTEVLTAMLVAIERTNKRKGSPVELLIMGLKDDSALSNEKTRKAYTDTLNSLEAALKVAASKQLEGKGSNVISKVPANVELLTRHFGHEVVGEVDHRVLTTILTGFANLLNMPVEFLGFVSGSGFSNEERFKTLYRIWQIYIETLRESLRPFLRGVIENFLFAQGVSPAQVEGVQIEFMPQVSGDEREEAEVSKAQADAAKVWADVAGLVAQYDVNLANQIIEEKLSQ